MLTINNELQKLSVWFRVNKLSLNLDKTNYILFGKRKVSPNFSIEIDNQSINRFLSTKFVGVQIDSELNWKNHIHFICNKLSKGIGILYKASFMLDTSSLLLLYNLLIIIRHFRHKMPLCCWLIFFRFFGFFLLVFFLPPHMESQRYRDLRLVTCDLRLASCDL